MVVVMCLIICSKFAKNRLSAGLRPDQLGELTALPKTRGQEGEGKEGGRRRRGGAGSGRGGKG